MELGHNIIETSLKREILEEVGVECFDNLTYLNS
jgi:NADH pyrophosphatase NudC (nudix superfamily)